MTELFSNTDSTAYTVSARKYRPKTFEGLVGQEAMVKVLTNAINTGRVPHAFILTGIRGVGKTTTARLLARALNCVGSDGKGLPTVNPCGICDSCTAIDKDSHIDVMEMDAASRTGVDDVREVIEAARYKAVSARYKIYIIDEVHMLSKSAFNALLKTLEEPPPHVKFIFATTEIRRVPETILSRCMRFDLKRIENSILIQHFQMVAENEGAKIDNEALGLLARAADGSARDGLSLLDQAITLSAGHVTRETIQEMLGLVDQSLTLDLYETLMSGEAAQGIDLFNKMYEQGADPITILQDLLNLTHSLQILKVAPQTHADNSFSENDKARLFTWSEKLSIPTLTRVWQVLLKGLEEVKIAPSALNGGHMVIVRLSYLSHMPTPNEVIATLTSEFRETQKKEISHDTIVQPEKIPTQANVNQPRPASQETQDSLIKAAMNAFPGATVEPFEYSKKE